MFSQIGTDTAQALEYANIRILQEDRGMRAEVFGIPKTIIVITDGDSDNFVYTIGNATALKNRGFNVITVGIGNEFTNENELLGMASSKNDAFKIDEYDKLAYYLSSLASSAYQKHARILLENEIAPYVGEENYKYLKFPLNNLSLCINETQSMKMITIKIEYNSSVELFYSFNETNPKSDEDFLSPNNKTDDEYAFILKNKMELSQINSWSIRYYPIEIPLGQRLENLYISIKERSNQTANFKIKIYDGKIDDATNSTTPNSSSPTTSTSISPLSTTSTSISPLSTTSISTSTISTSITSNSTTSTSTASSTQTPFSPTPSSPTLTKITPPSSANFLRSNYIFIFYFFNLIINHLYF